MLVVFVCLGNEAGFHICLRCSLVFDVLNKAKIEHEIILDFNSAGGIE